MKKTRIIKRVLAVDYDNVNTFVIQKRHPVFFWTWVDIFPHIKYCCGAGIPCFFTLDAAISYLSYFDTDAVVSDEEIASYRKETTK